MLEEMKSDIAFIKIKENTALQIYYDSLLMFRSDFTRC